MGPPAMVLPLAAGENADAAVLSDQPQSRSSAIFLGGLGLAAILTAVATVTLLLGGGLAGEYNALIGALLISSLVISAGLAGILAHRLMRVARAWRSAATGARLHVRFVTLFSLAAIAPAIVVAAFLGFTFSQGVERWFSQRVESTMESAAGVGRAYLDLAGRDFAAEIEVMAQDLNVARRGLTEDSARYLTFLQAQAEGRDLDSAYVISRDGIVLASAVEPGERAGYARPPPDDFAAADEGEVNVTLDHEHNRLLGLYRLTAYTNAYLLVSRPIEPSLTVQLRAFDEALNDYRQSQEQSGALRGLFAMAYVSTALIVLLAAGWVGLTSATRVAEPIGRLVGAARRVASGDLKARVAVGEERADIDALAAAFNRMTAQLDAQRRDLVKAQEDSEARRSFIEAVLGGVSAGVLGLDRDGRITALNSSAAQLLGVDPAHLVNRRLVDVAPEFSDLLNRPPSTGPMPPHRVDLVREGGTVNLSVRMSPEAEGGVVLTFDDMTKLISAQRQEAWKDVARRIAH